MHLDDFKAPGTKKAEATDKSSAKASHAAPESREPQSVEGPPRVLPEPDPVNRTKHKVIIRQTDEGIEEITKDNEGGVRLPKEDASVEPEKATASGEPKEGIGATGEQQPAQTEKESVPSTTSDWNAYAGKQTRFEVGPFRFLRIRLTSNSCLRRTKRP